MWSAEYNSAGGIWGCGCCADGGADGGPVNTLWAVYKSSSNSPKRPSVDVRPTAQASKDACCEADVVDQCVGNTVSGTSGLVAAPPDIICGSGMKPKSAVTKGRSVAGEAKASGGTSRRFRRQQAGTGTKKRSAEGQGFDCCLVE